jgi:hypothetical protein
VRGNMASLFLNLILDGRSGQLPPPPPRVPGNIPRSSLDKGPGVLERVSKLWRTNSLLLAVQLSSPCLLAHKRRLYGVYCPGLE